MKQIAAVLLATGLLTSCSRQQDKPLTQYVTQYAYTCSACGSTTMSESENPRHVRSSSLLYTNASMPYCKHHWKSGITCAYPTALKDGTLILVKKDNLYGAFILKEQNADPEKVVYEWWYRKDGKGTFDDAAAEVISGIDEYNVKADPRKKIAFGPFWVGWSGGTKGVGIVYYALNPGGIPSPSTTLISVTDKTNIQGVDGADARWHYGASPSDK